MQLPELAFDHKMIVREAFTQLARQRELQQEGVCSTAALK